MSNNAKIIECLSDEDLAAVVGGLNPQPLPPEPPPGHLFSFFTRFVINQHFVLPSLSLFRLK